MGKSQTLARRRISGKLSPDCLDGGQPERINQMKASIL
jgi:hypothetical protein